MPPGLGEATANGATRIALARKNNMYSNTPILEFAYELHHATLSMGKSKPNELMSSMA
jgi:hypothetical protein